MGEGVIQLSAWDLSLAAGLVLVAGVISLAFRLGLEQRLVIAAVRTVVQLLFIGYVLKYVFRLEHPALIGGVMLVMLVAASRAAVQRPSRAFPGIAWRAFGTLVLTATVTSVLVTGVVVRAEPWYRPQYLIPLLGMILGNGLVGISLCIDYLLEFLVERRREIEMELALGANRWEAARDSMREAIRRGMIPIISSMMVVGIVSLPGMMTGQILAGSDPVDAVKYQIVVMFMIAGATSSACMLVAGLIYRRLFNERHQLQVDSIRKQKS
jgi:putative ABC transport system permease protein